jgi:DNA topoisomerase-1
LGKYKGKELVTSIGRYGPYVRHGNQFYSLDDDTNVLEISKEEAIEVIKNAKKRKKKKTIQSFENGKIKVLRGPYGPYISRGRKNVSVPKDKDPSKLTLKECKQLLKNPKKYSKRSKKSASRKKS